MAGGNPPMRLRPPREEKGHTPTPDRKRHTIDGLIMRIGAAGTTERTETTTRGSPGTTGETDRPATTGGIATTEATTETGASVTARTVPTRGID